jgi:hypothetical protein
MKSYIAIIISVIAIVLAFSGGTQLGGYTAGHWDSADGYKVDGTTVIDGSGNIIGSADITTSGDVTITGETNLDTLIYGGDVTTLAETATAQTITAAQFCNSSIIRWDTSGTNSTATLPIAADLIADCIPTTGDTKWSILFENYGGEHVTFEVSSTTYDTLLEPSGGDVIIEDTEWALITAHANTATTVIFTITSLQDAD